MNVEGLKQSQQVALTDGNLAEVLEVLEGGAEVRIRYVDVMEDPTLNGSEAVVSSDDLVGVFEGTHTEGAVLGNGESAQWKPM
ncbi:MAG: hypothetical protein IIC95_10905 [Chloroflexi bacterium]|nr:hypothetical protein [Chloroflexota bacterium]MCH7656469.1 hypothetical protein [Chloroflexota bacterium]